MDYPRGTDAWVPIVTYSAAGGFLEDGRVRYRFGMAYVDFRTEQRTPKLSVAWFKEAARRNTAV